MDLSATPRNVSLALSTVNFKLFKHGTSYSIWAITLVEYSVPPFMSVKQL